MATPPTTNQTFKIVGTLDIVGNEDVTSPTFSSQGLIRMSRADGTPLGSIRGIADPTYRGLIVETAGMPAGFSVRTRLNQGPASIGGINDKYALNCTSNITTTSFLNCIADKTYNGVNQNFGQPMILAERYSTEDSSNTGGSSPIARFLQTVHKEDENVVIHLGARSKTVMGCLGYNMFSNVLSDRLWLGFGSPSSQTNAPIKCIKMDVVGNVEIPNKLTVTTITATNYLNLPPVPPAQLLPLTLNTTTNRVGINQTSPSAALDVTGNVHATGTVDAGNVAAQNSLLVGGSGTVGDSLFVQNKLTATTIEGTNWEGLPPTDVTPITLDQTNNRIGVNQSSPAFAVDVTGDVHATGTVGGSNLTASSNLAVAGNATINDVFVLDKVTTHTIEATNWIGLPTTDLTPITLDQTNNRIGINQPSPTVAVDVVGDVSATGTVGGNNLVVFNQADVFGPLICHDTLDVTGTTTTNTINAQTYLNLPPPDVLPITLDKTNNRVGINTVSPQYELHVSSQASIPNVTNIEYLKFGTSRPDFMFIRMSSASTPTLAADPGSLFLSSAGGGVWYKSAGIGNNANWVKLSQSDTSVGSAIMVRNPSLSIPSQNNVYFTLPTTNALISEWNTGSSETTTQVVNTAMGVTIEKASAQGGRVTFTKNGTYTITIRWKFAASSAGEFVVVPEFRLNNVNVPSNDYYNLQAPVSTAFATRQQLVFTRYIDTAIVNQMYTYIYMNSSSGTIDFTLGISKVT